jgi:hypothetical protein
MWHFLRVQKEDDPEAQPTVDHRSYQRSQPHIPLVITITVILLKSTFVSAFQPSPRIPIQLPQTPFTILAAIQLHIAYKASPHTPADNHLPSGTSVNNVSYHKLPNNPTKDRAKQSTSTPATKSRIFPTSHQFPSL